MCGFSFIKSIVSIRIKSLAFNSNTYSSIIMSANNQTAFFQSRQNIFGNFQREVTVNIEIISTGSDFTPTTILE